MYKKCSLENLAEHSRDPFGLLFSIFILLGQGYLLECPRAPLLRCLTTTSRSRSGSSPLPSASGRLALLGRRPGDAVHDLGLLDVAHKLLILLCRLTDLGAHPARALRVLRRDLLRQVVPLEALE